MSRAATGFVLSGPSRQTAVPWAEEFAHLTVHCVQCIGAKNKKAVFVFFLKRRQKSTTPFLLLWGGSGGRSESLCYLHNGRSLGQQPIGLSTGAFSALVA